MKFTYLFMTFIGLVGTANAASATCQNKIPADLATAVAKASPELSLPSTHDLDPESVAYNIKAGGDGCYVVASGSFEGRGRKSIALILISKNGKPDLTIASQRESEWKLHHLPTFCDRIASCYVTRGGPGTYVRTEALDSPPEGKTERTFLRSKNDVVISGTLESTGITYSYDSGDWLYVWTSD